jgi:polyferredoxin
MAAVGAYMAVSLATRETLDLNVIRDRSPQFVRLADGSLRNDYALKLVNMTDTRRRLAISVEGLDGARPSNASAEGVVTADAKADAVTATRVHVIAPAGVTPGSHAIRFTIRDLATGETASSRSAFLAGEAR